MVHVEVALRALLERAKVETQRPSAQLPSVLPEVPALAVPLAQPQLQAPLATATTLSLLLLRLRALPFPL